MKRKTVIGLMIAVLAGTMLAGCGNNEEQVVSETAVVSDVPEVPEETEEVDPHEGQVISELTGEWVDEELENQRPVAIMIGNTNETGVLPQAGISDADIIYEVTVEGGLTRLMAIFEDYASVEKIESIRSCRLYFLDYAQEFDAIYAHWGQSKYAVNALAAAEDLDGMTMSSYFLRDSSKKAPHNGYTTGENLVAAIEELGYSTEYDSGHETHFTFTSEEEPNELADGESALKVSPGYQVNKPYFEYNEKDGLYYRYQYDQAQTDANNDEQVAVKNVIVQFIPSTVMDSSTSTLNIDTVGSGEGYYITNGKAISVTWKKDSASSVTKYYDADGEEIELNPGKTWVSVVNNTYKDYFSIEGKKSKKEEN